MNISLQRNITLLHYSPPLKAGQERLKRQHDSINLEESLFIGSRKATIPNTQIQAKSFKV